MPLPVVTEGAGNEYIVLEFGALGVEGEAVSTKVGCKVVFPEVARLLEFLVEYGK